MSKYVTRTFPKKVLQLLLGEDIEDFEDLPLDIVSDKVYDNSRWSVHSRLVFSHGDKFYQVDYSRGATEYQDERPFENDSAEVICIEVKKTPVTVMKYLPVEQEQSVVG